MFGSSIDVGNPYRRLLNQPNRTDLVNAWGRTGFRRGLTNYPWFVDAKSGHIIASERDSHRLQLFDILGAETKYQPQGRYGIGTNQFISPGGVTTTNVNGADVIVADSGNRRICVMKKGCDFQGNGYLDTMFSFGKLTFRHPMGVEFDENRNLIVVSDTALKTVTLHDIHSGATMGRLKTPQHSPLQLPVDVTLDQVSRVYVTDAEGGCVHLYDKNGNFVRKFGEDILKKPWGICFDRQNNLLVSDEDTGKVLMYKEGGELNKVVTDKLYCPKGISVNQYEMLVVATGNPYNFLEILQFK